MEVTSFPGVVAAGFLVGECALGLLVSSWGVADLLKVTVGCCCLERDRDLDRNLDLERERDLDFSSCCLALRCQAFSGIGAGMNVGMAVRAVPCFLACRL